MINISTPRPLPENWLRNDALTAALLALAGMMLAVLTHLAGQNLFGKQLWLQVVGCALLAAPLTLRRRFPISAGVTQAALFIALPYLTGIEIYTANVVAFLGFYSIGAWSHHRRRAFWWRLLIVIAMAVWLIVSTVIPLTRVDVVLLSQPIYVFLVNVAINAAFFGGAWVFGNRVWQQWLEQQELEMAHADIQSLRDELVANAVELERARIARDLHDVVAHHVTAMSVQTAAARRVLTRDLDQATEMLQQVESSGRQAIQDLRTMVFALRTTESESMPRIAQIPDLVEQARTDLREVTWEVIGDIPECSASVELTCYRVAQEGLTNARKHAGPAAKVAVRVREVPDGIEIEVSDNGRGGRSLVPGTGTGLTGMRERVEAAGGTLHAGPKPDGGFLVRSFLPVGGTA